MRGIDNASYYRLMPGDERHYIDETGCGNTVNLSHPRVLQLVMDLLRYWVEEMHVDGFRFDLASTLGREAHGFDPGSGFFDAIRQDEVLRTVKLIAEPWDIGPGGYRLGSFPPGWAEWNDRFRDSVRRYWRGDEGMLPELAARLTGSSDLFEHLGRRPWASVNKITAHDGFTLEDLVSYDHKHNAANLRGQPRRHRRQLQLEPRPRGADRRPGDRGAAPAPEAQPAGHAAAVPGHADAARRRRVRPHPAGQQQRLLPGQRDQLVRLERHRSARTSAAGLRPRSDRAAQGPSGAAPRRFLHGRDRSPDGLKDITWLTPQGIEKTEAQWRDAHARCIGMLLNGRAGAYRSWDGRPEDDDVLLLLLNAHHDTVPFTPPLMRRTPAGAVCSTRLAADGSAAGEPCMPSSEPFPLPGRSLALFALEQARGRRADRDARATASRMTCRSAPSCGPTARSASGCGRRARRRSRWC